MKKFLLMDADEWKCLFSISGYMALFGTALAALAVYIQNLREENDGHKNHKGNISDSGSEGRDIQKCWAGIIESDQRNTRERGI